MGTGKKDERHTNAVRGYTKMATSITRGQRPIPKRMGRGGSKDMVCMREDLLIRGEPDSGEMTPAQLPLDCVSAIVNITHFHGMVASLLVTGSTFVLRVGVGEILSCVRVHVVHRCECGIRVSCTSFPHHTVYIALYPP